MDIAEFFWRIWGVISYVAGVMTGVFMVGFKMPKKSRFIIRLILCTAVVFAATYSYEEILGLFPDLIGAARLALRTTNSFLVFVLSAVTVKICFKCNIWASLFCATAGYCMQHMSQRLYVILTSYIPLDNRVFYFFLLIIITAPIYLAMFYFVLRKNQYHNIMVNNKVQIIVATCVVLLTIYLNSFAGREMTTKIGKTYVHIFSISSCILALFVEFGQLLKKNAEMERDIFKQLLYNERSQYYIEKEVIDIINIKSHDLKHQLVGLKGKIDEAEIEKISSAVNVYDSIFKTGNTALDIVLTKKSLLCESKKIKLTCMAYGEKLSFISDVDIYALFGNIIDNAIEAVSDLQDEDSRIISLTVKTKNDFVFICCENYISADKTIDFVDGIPQTTKNKDYHGFGMKSINYITQKYNGDFTAKVENNMFVADIMLPIK